MRFFFVFLFLIFSFTINPLYSQRDIVKKNLELIADDRIDEVKKQVPDLLARYHNDPGIMLLQGIVIDDASLAVVVFEKIVKEFPKSEWANIAEWRIIQYYAMTDNIYRAKKELQFLRKNYPGSVYILAACDVVQFAEKYYSFKKQKINNANYEEKETTDEKTKTITVKQIPKSPTSNEVEKKPILTKIQIQNKNNDNLEEKSLEQENDKTFNKVIPKNKDKVNKSDNKNESLKLEEKKVTYGLQVGVYSSEESALEEKERFRKSRLAAYILNKKVDDELMYSVVIGNYTTHLAAEEHQLEVKKICDCNPIIVEK